MIAVISIVFILATLVKFKHRTTVLAISILVLVVAGSLSINLIQDYFLGAHPTTQNVDIKLYDNLRLSDKQKSTLGTTFPDFKNITLNSIQYKTALEKTYNIKTGNVNSLIKVDLLLFKSKASADENFKQHQMFGESVYKMLSEKKFFMFEDSKKSDIKSNTKYITSFIRSNYSNTSEIMYVTKNIYYQSEIVIQDDDFILYMTEHSNKPVSEKNTILKVIDARLANVK